jgi:hypothetical protein
MTSFISLSSAFGSFAFSETDLYFFRRTDIVF